jgi:hypothetical protein
MDIGIDPKHMIGIDNGVFKDTTANDLTTLVGLIKPGQPIIVHIHGGLVTADDAIANGIALRDIYDQQSGAYPIFPIWHTGFLETVEANWTTIAGSVFARLLRTRILGAITDLLPHVFSQDSNKLSLAGTAEAPSLLKPEHWRLVAATAEEHLKQNPDHELYQAFQNLMAGREAAVTTDELNLHLHSTEGSLIRDSFVARANPVTQAGFDIFGAIGQFMSAVADIVKSVASRFADGTDHGMQATIWEEILKTVYVDTIGADVWDAMKRGPKRPAPPALR